MKKYCIYFCVFYNDKYIKLLQLALSSIKLSCNLQEIDILVLTDAAFNEKINIMAEKLEMPLTCIFKPFSSSFFAAACARLHIFDDEQHLNLNQYEKILYLDTDILIKKDIAPLFALDFAVDNICALEEGTIAEDNFGSLLFKIFEFDNQSTTIDWSLAGLNSGILLFHNNPTIKSLFQSIKAEITEWIKEGNEPPVCLDQPFINYIVIRENKFERNILQNWAGLFDFNGIPINHRELALCHFSWPTGNFESKYQRMQNYYNFVWTVINPLPPSSPSSLVRELSAY
jgi:lipopolysaccharide biosynthesis glycosyltransferase